MKFWLFLQLVLLKVFGLLVVVYSEWDVLGWGLFFGGGFWVIAHHLFPRFQGLCDVVSHFETKKREVWLTLDDGPDPEDTPAILAMLDRYCGKATFFMIGARAERHPELVAQVLAAGHSVGSHTYSHPLADFWCAGPRRVAFELDRSLTVLKGAGAAVRYFRSPVGIKNMFLRQALKSRGLRCIAWSLRSGDGVGRDPEEVVQRVMREVRPGAILLMHEGASMHSAVRLRALEGVLTGLREKGYRCVLPEPDTLR